MTLRPVICGYHLEQVLGVGRSGTVWAARQDRGLELEVAVKVIHPHLVYSELDARFEVEKAALSSLRHPGIASVLEAGTNDEGLPYLVLERIDGLPIDAYCDQHALPIEQRLELFLRCADAVEAAHRQGILHRDLKPSNILVSTTGDVPQPKIIDFGLAKILDPTFEHALESMVGSQLGTPLYMAPEQFGFAGPVDTRADVHALGAVLYELLTGCHVFDLEQFEGLDLGQQRDLLTNTPRMRPSQRVERATNRDAIAQARSTNPRRLVRRLRGELDAICMHALARDREARYSTAKELSSDILRHLRGEPLQLRTPTVGYVLRKAALRNRALTVTTALALTVIAILGVRLVDATRTARLQASDARALADFLLGHFSGQEPGSIAEPLARSEVDRAHQELLAAEPARDPRSTARALGRLAEAYEQLGDFARSDALLGDASALLFGPDVADTVMALGMVLDRSRLAMRSQRPDRADSLAQDVLTRAASVAGGGSIVREAHSARGRSALARGKLPDAIASFRLALELGDAQNVDRSTAARLRSDLGHALNRVRRHEEAARHLRAALALLDGHSTADREGRARVLHNLGVTLCGLADFDAAVPLLEEAAALQRTTPGGRDVLGGTLHDLGNAVWETGDGARALLLYLEALQIKRDVFGERAVETASTLSSLGDLYGERGRRLEAIACYRDAAAIVEEAHGPDHPTLAALGFNLGQALENEGFLEEALAHFERAALMDSIHYGADHPITQDDRQAVQRVRAALMTAKTGP